LVLLAAICLTGTAFAAPWPTKEVWKALDYDNPVAQDAVKGVPQTQFLGADERATPFGTVDVSFADKGLLYIDFGEAAQGENIRLLLTMDAPAENEELNMFATRPYLKAGFFPLIYGPGEYTLFVYKQNSGDIYDLSWIETQIVSDFAEEEPWKYANVFSEHGDASLFATVAANLCEGEVTDAAKARNICAFVSKYMKYDKALGADIKSGLANDTLRSNSADDVFENGNGVCVQYAMLMNAMCRSVGIPSREVWGHTDAGLYHAWNEVWAEGVWVTADPLANRWDVKGYEKFIDTYR
jgi:hypothetical protein